ncbi:MAG: polysaccharide deacetylase family protein [Pseudomonadota bacterium]
MRRPVIDILMYHSISGHGGPTAIAPDVFAMQMEVLASSGLPVLTLDDLLEARRGLRALAPRSVILTFDDGFEDFAAVAWPILERRSFRPIVYLPTGFIGRSEGWRGTADPPRPLMGWNVIRALAGEGVLFGSHTVSHPDLTALAPAALEQELVVARREIEDRLGRRVPHFAPPYGLTRPATRRAVARHYETSAGTTLGTAADGDDLHDLPRIEMYYYRDRRIWERHLAGQGALYLAQRRTLRTIRAAVRKPWTAIRP